MNRISAIFLISIIFMFFLNASYAANPIMNNVTELNLETIQKLESKAIYFGHQSVGNNIVNGLNGILSGIEGNKIRVLLTTSPGDIKAGVFAHSPVGENFKPASKDAEFAKNIFNITKLAKIDVAFYKYCYVDIQRDTDVEALFNSYKRNYDILMASKPEVKFIHLTTPLTVVQKGPRAWIKKIIGRPLGGYAENKKRGEFNELLRKTYGSSGLVFDLAKLESTYADGSREMFTVAGKQYEALIDNYASDGRHLNELGSRYIARELLLFLVNNS